MIENNPTNVVAAFEILLEEVEAEIEFINRVGARAFEGRDYDRAREVLERAAQLTAFRDRVAALQKDWDGITAAPVARGSFEIEILWRDAHGYLTNSVSVYHRLIDGSNRAS